MYSQATPHKNKIGEEEKLGKHKSKYLKEILNIY